jgi:hypothetical protein
MVLQKQNISFDFGKGLNEVVDSDLVAGGTLLTVKDGVYNKGGRVDKRDGYNALSNVVLDPTAIPSTGILNGITGVHNNNGKLIASESTRVLAYNEGEEVWTANQGFYRSCKLSKEDVVGIDGNIIRASAAELGDIRVIAFGTEGHVSGYKVMDKVSKTTLFVTYDINQQLWDGRYTDRVRGGEVNASQYTEPTIVRAGDSLFLFVVKDRYNFRVDGAGLVPEPSQPVGDGTYGGLAGQVMGCSEAPKLIMFGINLDTYQLTTSPFTPATEKHLNYFNLEPYNNWNLILGTPAGTNPSVPIAAIPYPLPAQSVNQITDQRYCSYDVCVMQTQNTGERNPNLTYMVLLLSSYETVKLYTINSSGGQTIDTAEVALNSPSGGPGTTNNGFTHLNSASMYPCNSVALGQTGNNSVRTWIWRYNNDQGTATFGINECWMRAYDIDPNTAAITVKAGNTAPPIVAAAAGANDIGLNVPIYNGVSQPWSSYDPMTNRNIISAEDGSGLFTTTSELSEAATGIAPGGLGWFTTPLYIPLNSSAISEPFLYLADPQALTDPTRYEMAIALTPKPTDLKTNFIIAEGNLGQNVIAKYSQGTAEREAWGLKYDLTAVGTFVQPNGCLPYNANWDIIFTAPLAPPLPMRQVLANIGQFTAPRLVPIKTDSLSSGVFDLFTLPSIEAIQAEVEAGEISGDGRVRDIKFDLSSRVSPDFIDYANDLYLNGGYMAIFDNNITAENNFHLKPDFDITTGTVVDSGDWAYCCTYEWLDDNGNLHRSQPSSLKYTSTNPFVGGGFPLPAASVILDITQPIFTSKIIDEVSVCVYRTVQNGAVFYRVSKLTPNVMPDSPGPPNTQSRGNDSIKCWFRGLGVTFEDRLDDTAIIGNEVLYTTGGVLPNVAPPSFNVMTEFGGRVFGSGLDNPNRVYYSKIKDPNTSVEFSDALYLTIPPEGGSITGLSVLDSNLIVFKENKVYRVYGEGPNDTGAGGAFSEPLLISSSHGAKTKKAIINTVEGVVFRGTDGGIYNLDRSLNFTYIGGPVEDSNDLDIVHATNVGAQSEIRFVLEDGEALVYNYWFKVWTRFTNHTSVDSTVYNDKFVMARADSSKGIWIQSPGSYLDLTEPILLDVETSWIKLAGIKGFQRCNWFSILGEQTDAHDIDVTIYRDYNTDPIESFTVDGADIFDLKLYGDPSCGTYGDPSCGTYGWPGDDVYQWRHKPEIQKTESIKLKFKDSAALSGVYDPLVATNFSLKNLTLYIGVKTGQFKLPERKTV